MRHDLGTNASQGLYVLAVHVLQDNGHSAALVNDAQADINRFLRMCTKLKVHPSNRPFNIASSR